MLNKALLTVSVALFALLSIIPTSARIVGFSAPTKVLYPRERFHITFHTAIWIIDVHEYYAVFGIAAQPTANEGLGELLGQGYDLVAHGHGASGAGSFSVELQIPPTLSPPHKSTKYLLTSAVLITAGLPNGVTVDYYTANITISP